MVSNGIILAGVPNEQYLQTDIVHVKNNVLTFNIGLVHFGGKYAYNLFINICSQSASHQIKFLHFFP